MTPLGCNLLFFEASTNHIPLSPMFGNFGDGLLLDL